MNIYWKILGKYKRDLMVGPLLVLAGVVCETVQPRLMAEIIDDGIMSRDLGVVSRVGWQMILLSIAGLVASIVNISLSARVSTRAGADLRRELFGAISRLSLAAVDRFGAASLVTRLTNDVTRLQHAVMTSTRLLARAPLLFILAFVFIVEIDAGLSLLLSCIVLPVAAGCSWWISRRGAACSREIQREVDRLTATVRENLINFRVVKASGMEGRETGKFSARNEALRAILARTGNLFVLFFPVIQLAANLTLVAILWAGGLKVVDGEIKIGELVSFINYLAQVLVSLMMFSMIATNFSRASASSVRVLEVLGAAGGERAVKGNAASGRRVTRGEILLRDVRFRFPGARDDLLEGITLRVSPGEMVAIIGHTGSGKSTLAQLIPGLREASGGEVLVDGVNVKEYGDEELRERVRVVLQDDELFSGTIRDNLSWGNPAATPGEIDEATRVACIRDFIASLPGGLDAPVARGGANLSGGQKQRLCIARALLSNPVALILDDSTSAVDAVTERMILQNLRRGQRSLVLVTRQPRATLEADRVVILEAGRIVDDAPPAVLLERSRVYREICRP
ncbi:MAG: ABC transporter ATP-binding protein/permease [Odoribacteraceae bacterium]|jgi:ATP-binding cassette subfamily B protein|nr:ABC transporter ATP-binding protein/permease [Odoribacteraceae bacterium]